MARDIKTTLTLDNKQFQRSIKQSKQSVDGFEQSTVQSTNSITKAFIAIGGAAALGGIVRTGAAFQDLRNSLNVVFGSIDAGGAAFERVKDFAANTQFSVQQLTQAFVQLKGAGVEPTEELLMTFADTASVTTDQMGTFQAALDLVSRSTAGGLGLEDLNRLADRGIPVFNILQEKLGLTRLEVSKFGKTTEGANRIISALLDGLNEDFGGALAGQFGLINFELNQLGDAFDNLKVALFSTFADDAGAGIQNLTGAVNKLADNMDSLVSVLKILGFAFIGFRLLTKDLSKAFIVMFDKIKGLLTGTGMLARNFLTLKDALRLVGMGIAGLGLRGFIAAIGGALAVIAPWAAGIIAVGLALYSAGKFVKSFFVDTENATEAVKNNAHVIAFKAEQDRLAKEEAQKLADKTKAAADAAEAFQRGFDKASKSVESFKDEIFDSNDPLSNYQTFLSELLESSNGMAVEQVFAAKAVETLKGFLDNGLISARAYGFAMDKLKGITGETNTALEGFGTIVDQIQKSTANYNLLLERLVELQTSGAITADEFKTAKADLDVAFTENEGLESFLDTLGRAQKSLSEDLVQAFRSGESASGSFKKMFRTVIDQIIADVIRLSIIQPILSAILGPFGYGFGSGGSVIKLPGKATGGPVSAGGSYLVGERGPEILNMGSQGGHITPNNQLGGTTNVYNISAVDTQSFKMALAKDPEFIYNLTRAGSRRVPG